MSRSFNISVSSCWCLLSFLIQVEVFRFLVCWVIFKWNLDILDIMRFWIFLKSVHETAPDTALTRGRLTITVRWKPRFFMQPPLTYKGQELWLPGGRTWSSGSSVSFVELSWLGGTGCLVPRNCHWPYPVSCLVGVCKGRSLGSPFSLCWQGLGHSLFCCVAGVDWLLSKSWLVLLGYPFLVLWLENILGLGD